MTDDRADNTSEAARTIVSHMKITERRADNQPGAVRTSVFESVKRRAVPSAPF